LANLGALCGKGVRSFGDDDPRDEVSDGSDAGEEGNECREETDEVEVPAVVEGEAGADSGDHAVVAGARELAGVWIVAWRRRRRRGDSGSAGRAEAGGSVDLIAALRTEHERLRKTLFCHRETVAYRKQA
jgi:hypothetical protein